MDDNFFLSIAQPIRGVLLKTLERACARNNVRNKSSKAENKSVSNSAKLFIGAGGATKKSSKTKAEKKEFHMKGDDLFCEVCERG